MTVTKKRAPKAIGKIEDETAVLPSVIAGCVCDEVSIYLDREFRRSELEAHLCERAQEVYELNAYWRKKFKQSKGRDYFYIFMRHWSAAWLMKQGIVLMPQDFANGLKLPYSVREGNTGIMRLVSGTSDFYKFPPPELANTPPDQG